MKKKNPTILVPMFMSTQPAQSVRSTQNGTDVLVKQLHKHSRRQKSDVFFCANTHQKKGLTPIHALTHTHAHKQSTHLVSLAHIHKRSVLDTVPGHLLKMPQTAKQIFIISQKNNYINNDNDRQMGGLTRARKFKTVGCWGHLTRAMTILGDHCSK